MTHVELLRDVLDFAPRRVARKQRSINSGPLNPSPVTAGEAMKWRVGTVIDQPLLKLRTGTTSVDDITVATNLIREAFKDAERPLGAIFEDNWYRPADAESAGKAFEGRCWQEMSHEDLLENYDAIYFFNDEAFRYYLPAFMIDVLQHFNDADHLVDEVPAALVPPSQREDKASFKTAFARLISRDTDARFEERVAGFSRPQKRAIQAFLRALNTVDADPEPLNRRAAAYWTKRAFPNTRKGDTFFAKMNAFADSKPSIRQIPPE